MVIAKEIFRAYDVRGEVDGHLTSHSVFLLGKAIATKVLASNENKIVVARDGRLSGPSLQAELIAGITQAGCDVIDIGLVPTPVLYFASHFLQVPSAIMLTGSHNPANYNGLKIMIAGQALYENQITELYNLIVTNQLATGKGTTTSVCVLNDYISKVKSSVTLAKPQKIVIDCGNGAAGVIVERLYSALGIDCIPLYCDVDGNFPNHHPDPGDPRNLQDLQQAVIANCADLGIAFDGDGDRLGVIDNKGKIIWADRYLMLFAKDILNRNPGATVIYDIKSTNKLEEVIKKAGGKPLMWRTGHSLIKAKMRQTGAMLAGEMSGHIFIRDRWLGFDDALYAAARLLELASYSNDSFATLCAKLPENHCTPEIAIAIPDCDKHNIIEKLIANAKFNHAIKVTTIDGLRVDFSDGWGLVRASNTTPNLIARFEAVSSKALQNIQSLFRDHLSQLDVVLP